MTPKERVAMHQALEALEQVRVLGSHRFPEAITALREALAEQSTRNALDSWKKNCNTLVNNNKKLKEQLKQMEEMKNTNYRYTPHEQRIAEQAEQEPVAVVEDWPTDKTPKGIVALGDIKELPAGTLLYASPATSTEVFTREKVDSLLIAAYTKGRNVLLEKQAEQEPVAEIDAHGRLVLGLNWNQVPFGSKLYAAPVQPVQPVKQEPVAWMLEGSNCVEFEYRDYHDGYEWTPLFAEPVRTKDLTDDELLSAWGSVTIGCGVSAIKNMRAVIAADREKNRG